MSSHGSTFEQARDFFLRGLAHYEAGRLPDAERQFEASLALLPGRASTLTNLGAVRVQLGRHAQALPLLQEALAQEPDNVEALAHQALALAELGQAAQALATTERLLALVPQYGRGWSVRGRLLREMGRHAEAIVALERAVELGHEVDVNRYILAGLRGEAAPAAAPDEYVRSLFDGYADQFEQHLTQVLQYRGPQLLLQPLVDEGLQVARALDLGCGTGLCGALLRRMARHVAGVDLSGAMIEKAQATGCYDELAQDELVRWLRGRPQPAQLVVAADVFVYVGELRPVFEALQHAASPGARLCFSIEEGTDDAPLALRPSLRYAHARAPLERLAAEHGWQCERVLRAPVRTDQRASIPGLFFWMRKR